MLGLDARGERVDVRFGCDVGGNRACADSDRSVVESV